jgi:2-(acetamidomethylene)succinate hydrolase
MAIASVAELRVQTSGPALAAWMSGERDAVPVLLLHGTSANGRVWDEVVAAVRTPIRAIQLDQRGHGRSDEGDGHAAADFATDAEAVLEALADQPALVVGHSMGARNAWVLAARRPDLVRGVLAVDYTPFVEAEVLDALDARVRGGDRAFATDDEVRDYLRARYPRLPETAIERRARFGYGTTEEGIRPLARPAALAALVEGLRTDYPEEYAGLAVPMVSVRGEDSLIVSPAAWASAQRLAPHVRAVELADADHYVHEEQPAAIAAHIDAMLDAPDDH